MTLNLKQWRSSGSINNAYIRYQALQLSGSTIISYLGEDTVNGYYPDGSSSSAQLKFSPPSLPMNNCVIRITSLDSYNVSGYGEAYNY